MAKKKSSAVSDVELKDLETAVDEVNEQLDLDPEIEKGTDKEMRKALKEVMEDEDEELFEGNEEFTKETYAVFEALGIEHDAVKIKDENIKKGENEKVKTKTKTTQKKSVKKKAVRKVAGAYSKMIDILCSHPGMSRDDLRKRLAKKGVKEYKDTAFNTAYQSCNSVFNRLASNGKLKLNGKG